VTFSHTGIRATRRGTTIQPGVVRTELDADAIVSQLEELQTRVTQTGDAVRRARELSDHIQHLRQRVSELGAAARGGGQTVAYEGGHAAKVGKGATTKTEQAALKLEGKGVGAVRTTTTGAKSSISAIGFRRATLMIEAAGYWPSCGSTGPNTACSQMTISSAASAINVPPDMA
jgi:hypothetical protein